MSIKTSQNIKTRLTRAEKLRPPKACPCEAAGYRAYGSQAEMENDPGCPLCGRRPWEIKGVAIKILIGVSMDDL